MAVIARTSTSRRTKLSVHEANLRDAFFLQVVTVVFVLVALMLMLSSSSVISISEYGSGLALFERQLLWTVVGCGAYLVARRITLERLRRYSLIFMVLTVGALLLVLVAGQAVGGSSRWIGVGFFKLQPTEFAKLIFTIFAADFISCRERTKHPVREIVVPLGCCFGVMAICIVIQPDLGSTIMLTVIFFALLFGSGIDRRIFVRTVLLISTLGVVFALQASYRRARLLSFISPFGHASTSGYQLVQSLLALGSGHLTGTGFGASSATWGFLPNAQTDFIFAVIGNQYGFVGAMMVMVGFAVIAVLGIRISMRATDRFSSLLALGLTTWIVGQAIINIGGVISIMPETGIPLPFLSFGGSSLIAVLAGVGLLVNIAHNSGVKTRTNEASKLLLNGIFAHLLGTQRRSAR